MTETDLWKFKPYTRQTVRQAPQWSLLPPEQREAVDIVARVLPFRVNPYVLGELIDWDAVPDDPIYRLTFPHRSMLRAEEYAALRGLIRAGAPEAEIEAVVRRIRLRMNPHPAGQMTDNVPKLDGVPLPGIQHKYRETVLFFPSAWPAPRKVARVHSWCRVKSEVNRGFEADPVGIRHEGEGLCPERYPRRSLAVRLS